jgi:WhiB family transcriptional regulator, redox-sensing transcriptional regulator
MWRDDALCKKYPQLPWIDEPKCVSGRDRHDMLSVCSHCPVFAECLAFVKQHGIVAGFWAGRFRHSRNQNTKDTAA